MQQRGENKKHKLIAASLMLGAMTFTPQFNYCPLMSVAYAEVQTYTGTGEYVMSNFETPDSAMARAEKYALRDAQEQAGVYVQSYSKTKNLKLVEDEITTMTAGIINVIDKDFKAIPIESTKGVIKYIATVKVKIDTDDISKWLERNSGDKLNNLIEQTKALQQALAERERENEELRKQISNVKTQQDKEKLTKQFAKADEKFAATQKADKAKIFYDNGKYQNAIDSATQAIKLDNTLAVAYNIRGNAYYSLGQYERAIEDCNKALELNPKNDMAYNNRGGAYALLGQYKRAIEDYNKAIELNPKNDKAYNNRGNIYAELGQNEKAIQDFNKAIEINPKLSEAYYNRGNAYYDLKQNERAIQDYNKAIELNPKDYMAYNNRGVAYNMLKQYKQAIADFTKAIELNPTYVKTYRNRGDCYKALGDKARAEADYKKAEQLKNKT